EATHISDEVSYPCAKALGRASISAHVQYIGSLVRPAVPHLLSDDINSPVLLWNIAAVIDGCLQQGSYSVWTVPRHEPVSSLDSPSAFCNRIYSIKFPCVSTRLPLKFIHRPHPQQLCQ